MNPIVRMFHTALERVRSGGASQPAGTCWRAGARRGGQAGFSTADRGLSCLVACVLVLALGVACGQAAERRVLYETGFEVSEGYARADAGLALWEQDMGWYAEGSGGCGLVDDFFPEYGQQAFIGFSAPAPKDDVLTVWRPVGVTAPPRGYSVLQFSVLMQVVDSDNHQYDDFQWSIYNTEGYRLFTLNFDNSRLEIFYALDDDSGFYSSGYLFDNDVIYLLEIWMDFANNRWQAILNGESIVDSQPIPTTGARLDFSDADAVWVLGEKGKPGSNYLLFDEYRITAEPTSNTPPVLEIVGLHPTGQFELLLRGQPGLNYAIDVTDEFLAEWLPLQTNAAPSGLWRFIDDSAKDYAVSYYRARQVSGGGVGFAP